MIQSSLSIEAQKTFGRNFSYERAKAAYEGTWRYEDDSTIFVIRLKCFYTSKMNADIRGTFSLVKNGVTENDYHYLLYSIIDESEEYEILRKRILSHEPDPVKDLPIYGVIYKGGNVFWYRGPHKPYIIRESFSLKVGKLNKSNKFLYWDIWSAEIRPKGSVLNDCKIHPSFLRIAKEGDYYPIPEKCTLTRISHDPMYGL